MLYSVMFFGALGVVPLIHRAYEVAGDTSDPFESYVSVCLGSSAIMPVYPQQGSRSTGWFTEP